MRFRHAQPRPRGRLALVAAVVAGAPIGGVGLLWSQASAHQDTPLPAAAVAAGIPARNHVNLASQAAPRTTTTTTTTAPAPTTPAPTVTTPPAPPTSKVLTFSFQLQENGYYCGPAATRIALAARGIALSQDDVAGRLGTTEAGTNSSNDTTRVLNSLVPSSPYQARFIGGDAATAAQISQLQTDVVHAVANGYAVVVNVVGSASSLGGLTFSYGGGHYLTVVGYDRGGETVKIADPANVNGDGTYWMNVGTLANWAAHRGYAAA